MWAVYGKTWEHRNMLRNAGAHWNDTLKRWVFNIEPDAGMKRWIASIDLTLTELPDMKPASKPVEPARDPIRAPSSVAGATAIHGDDPTWFNTFRSQNPTAFFGFSSLASMVNYVRTIDPDTFSDIDYVNRRNQGWRTDEAEWYGTTNMTEALNLVENGWQAGVDQAAELVEMLEANEATHKRRFHDVAGGSVNVGRMLSGNPVHMTRRAKQPSRKVVTLFSQTSTSSKVSAKDAMLRAAILTAVVDQLENNGYSAEIVAISTTMNYRNKPLYQLAVPVKRAGEALNLSDIAFTFGHPSFLRRMIFACTAGELRLSGNWRNMGFMDSAFQRDGLRQWNMPTGQFYIPNLISFKSSKQGIERATSMASVLIPENFPVQLSWNTETTPSNVENE